MTQSRIAGPQWSYSQSALFDEQQAEQALNEAVERVEQHAEPGWIEAALSAVKLIARHRAYFTTDPVWAVLERRNVEAPHEPRALGAVMRRAQKMGFCVAADKTPVKSKRTACHRRDLKVWRSLIFQETTSTNGVSE